LARAFQLYESLIDQAAQMKDVHASKWDPSLARIVASQQASQPPLGFPWQNHEI